MTGNPFGRYTIAGLIFTALASSGCSPSHQQAEACPAPFSAESAATNTGGVAACIHTIADREYLAALERSSR